MNLVRDVIAEAKNWYTAATWTEKDIPNLEVGGTALCGGGVLPNSHT